MAKWFWADNRDSAEIKGFMNQRPRTTTVEDIETEWGGRKRSHRCYLCGHRFKVGDVWRWVYSGGRGVINFVTCAPCDGKDVLDRFVAMNKELTERFWWAI